VNTCATGDNAESLLTVTHVWLHTGGLIAHWGVKRARAVNAPKLGQDQGVAHDHSSPAFSGSQA
jgi:hypothetical protein